MSLLTIPQEVLERILLHVNTEDVLSVLTALKRQTSEAFWRRFCLHNGYKKLSSEDETWKEVAYRIMAWSKGSYLKKDYDLCDPNVGGFSLGELQEPPRALGLTIGLKEKKLIDLKGNRLLLQKGVELLIKDAGNPKTLLQKLQGWHQEEINQSGTKLLVEAPDAFVIYDQDKDQYIEIYAWPIDLNYIPPFNYVLSDDYFVILKTDIFVVYLKDKQKFSIENLPGQTILTFRLTGQIVNILVYFLGETFTRLKRFDLERKEWLEGLQLFENSIFGGIRLNLKFIVNWCRPKGGTTNPNQVQNQIKIWSLEDNLRLVSTFTTEKVKWCLLEANYLLYSSAPSSFTILNLNQPETSWTTLEYNEDYSLGQKIISNFLLLSYSSGFKLVDFKKATYVREVSFDDGLIYTCFSANEYFYIAYGWLAEEPTNCHTKLCVYDFSTWKGQRW